jgi:hypothetical protein
MKYQIYRITLESGDWFDVAGSTRWWAIGTLVAVHYATLTTNQFREIYKPRAMATGMYAAEPGPIRSNTYEV